MRTRFTISDLQKSKCAHLNTKVLEKKDVPILSDRRKTKKISKEKAWISTQLWAFCREQNLEFVEEYKFHPTRKWRFDWAITERRIAIEYEGLMSEKSRHTTKKGFTGDTDKYNEAQIRGWKVIRVTALNYKNLIKLLDKTFLDADQ